MRQWRGLASTVRMRSADFRTATAPLPDVLQFMQLLWAVVHGVERRSKRMALDVGVTAPQRLVVRVVGLFPDVSAGGLAAILHVHPSTLTGILHRLVTQQLLRRSDDARDRRRALFRLTARGLRVNALALGTIEAAIAAALRESSARDRASTRRVLQRLARHLEPPAGPARRRARRPSRRTDRA
jgi:DNA-binding MarR family transcriptional regulator